MKLTSRISDSLLTENSQQSAITQTHLGIPTLHVVTSLVGWLSYPACSHSSVTVYTPDIAANESALPKLHNPHNQAASNFCKPGSLAAWLSSFCNSCAAAAEAAAGSMPGRGRSAKLERNSRTTTSREGLLLLLAWLPFCCCP